MKIGAHRDTPRIIAKTRQTNLERYGVEWTTQTPNMRRKSDVTKQRRYGTTTFNNVEQAKATCSTRYGVPHTNCPTTNVKRAATRALRFPELRDREWLAERNRTHSLTDIAIQLGVTRSTVDTWMKQHRLTPIIHTKGRRLEPQIAEKLRTLGCPFEQNTRCVIAPKELDFYWPKQRVAVEINGLYWHANDPHRHRDKHIACRTAGIRLLQFWDYEWVETPHICLSIVAQALGRTPIHIHGRQCSVRPLTTAEYRAFLITHHLMGYAAATWKYGLVHQGKTVAVMGIGASRFRRGENELIRFACAVNHHVSGGFTKLLHRWTDGPLTSYTDTRLFSGQGYQHAGFVRHHTTPPSYFYFRHMARKSRFQCQKHKLAQWLPEYDAQRSEAENMGANGWGRVYDCGQDVWVWRP